MTPDKLNRLKTAFAMHVAQKLANADEIVHPDEVEWIHDALPFAVLESHGFVDPGSTRLTPAFREAAREAVEVLPVELSTEVAGAEGIAVSDTWRAEFDDHMAAQRARSRAATRESG